MLSFFNSSRNFDKFVVCGNSEVSLYELKEKSHEPDFIYDYPKLQTISKFALICYRFHLLRILFTFCRQLEIRQSAR